MKWGVFGVGVFEGVVEDVVVGYVDECDVVFCCDVGECCYCCCVGSLGLFVFFWGFCLIDGCVGGCVYDEFVVLLMVGVG